MGHGGQVEKYKKGKQGVYLGNFQFVALPGTVNLAS